MGRLFYPLGSIPVLTGEEKTLPLLSHSGKSQHGTISLHLNIKAVKETLPVEVCFFINLVTMQAIKFNLKFKPRRYDDMHEQIKAAGTAASSSQ